jgi:hypothetical protein
LDRRPDTCLFREGTFQTERPAPLRLSLDALPAPVRTATVRFVTPTELKTEDGIAARPEFPALYGRARDRVSTLRGLYGRGPLPLDFREAGERAAHVALVRCNLQYERSHRRSSRTGQVHPLGGFVGTANYEGDLREFLPVLRAASWTGVGRQTVWGKGHIEVLL